MLGAEYMRRLKIFSLILGIVCLSISGIAIFNSNDNDDVSNKNNEREIETINTEDKIGVNTDFVVETLYTMCGHTIIEKVEIDKSVINLTYQDIVNMYRGYDVVKFDSSNVLLKNTVNEYCKEHFLIKEEDNKIGLYSILADNNLEHIRWLDISIDMLRQNDRYMFKNAGVTIYGKENLYKFLEDFDS